MRGGVAGEQGGQVDFGQDGVDDVLPLVGELELFAEGEEGVYFAVAADVREQFGVVLEGLEVSAEGEVGF